MILNPDDQFLIFSACFFAGALSCFPYAFFTLLRSLTKNKIVRLTCDLGYFCAVFVIYEAINVRWRLPDVRPYMIAAVLLGALSASQIVRILLAKPCA
ncbi:MAG: hypothetical protein J6U35_00220 [Clostridia bacterium]|nr:hypothetical protein [Clostridia bacterium]